MHILLINNNINNISLINLLIQLIIILFVFLFLFLNQYKIEAFSATKKRGQSKKQSTTTDFGINNWKRGGKELEEEKENNNELIILNEENINIKLIERIRLITRPYHRPVKHFNDVIEVFVRCSLYQIVDLDQRNNLATLSAYFDVKWRDAFLNWNISEFDGITNIFIPLKWVWKPEFYLYHSIQGRTPEYDHSAMVELNNNGYVRLFVPITSRALCPINVKYFPYDMQNCTFLIGSWSYQSQFVRFSVDSSEVFLGDFYDNQEWLLIDAIMQNGTMEYLGNESFSMIQIVLILRRQSFYYVFNLVFPTTLVSLVAVIGFHAPINATGRRESKFRLGVMTLLSLSVMLLMLVDEMKFALESIPGQRGSFSDVPLIGIYYISLILTISVATCTSSIFVHLEKYALRNSGFSSIPNCLKFLSAQKLFCCYVPRKVKLNKGEKIKKNKNINCNYFQSTSMEFSTIAPNELNFIEFQKREGKQQQINNNNNNNDSMIISSTSTTSPLLLNSGGGGGGGGGGSSTTTTTILENQKIECKLDLLISLLRELIEIRRELKNKGHLPIYWELFSLCTQNFGIKKEEKKIIFDFLSPREKNKKCLFFAFKDSNILILNILLNKYLK
ncbi:Neur_chan_LBD domain-containing protein [Meloidogyne graminicola]|uniref:Neur_chan_LBD domain-containing protein n=1 Tax=Meloidogyne graminicola TaxID=189291 RepID=A0A8S9ZXL0_9BILA|nr:Neur_chan_LBD domain-containing protein [Meloidogyne graminicola]